MTISDIPTDTFNRILADLLADGWRQVYEYDGMDAWIDYGKVELQRDDESLMFEWDNWFEGIIEGRPDRIKKLIVAYALTGESSVS